MEEKLIRLNKFISESGFCSRREADSLIEQGRVRINGKLGELGSKVSAGDLVEVDGKAVARKAEAVYLAFNKPVGVVCTTDLREKDNIVDYIGYPERIFPIGRLDKPSEGLIFLTNDGDIVNKILRATNNHEKEYIVSVNKPITADFLNKMRAGVPILDTVTLPCVIEKMSAYVFKIILTQGLNRQIRRMCEYLGYEVVQLKRVRIMHIRLDKLQVGKYRKLTAEEVEILQDLLADSVKNLVPIEDDPELLEAIAYQKNKHRPLPPSKAPVAKGGKPSERNKSFPPKKKFNPKDKPFWKK